jgi:uncharacterized membrane protein YqiK
MNAGSVIVAIVAIVVAIAIAWLILWKLYQRSTTEKAFVRTGFLGQKVVINGGAIVIPVLHDVTRVNMNTIRIEVQREKAASLVSKDRMRIDVHATFYVRIDPSVEAVARAAQSLGARTDKPEQIAELLQDRFVAALRSHAATMTIEELYERRGDYIAAISAGVGETLEANGLLLESASITRLEQSDREFFNPTNAFDAEGLTRLTRDIEERRRLRNEIEQDSLVAIELKNLEAERRRLEIQRDEEQARLDQQKAISVSRAEQQAEVARYEAEQRRLSEQAEIESREAVELARQRSQRQLDESRIQLERQTRDQEIDSQRGTEIAEIERRRDIELAEQLREIALADQASARSAAQVKAEQARAEAIRAEEAVLTARETERAERNRQVALTNAMAEAEREGQTQIARAQAAQDAAVKQAETTRILTEAEAAAEKLRAEAYEIRAHIEAEAQRQSHEAENALSEEARTLRLKLSVVEHMEAIVRESVRPIEKIDGVKVLHVDGLGGLPTSGAGAGAAGGEASWSDQLVQSALRHRGQAPLVDYLVRELGLGDGTAAGLADALTTLAHDKDKAAE